MDINKLENIKIDLNTMMQERYTIPYPFYSGDKNTAGIEFEVLRNGTMVDLKSEGLDATLEISTQNGLYHSIPLVISGNKATAKLDETILLNPGRARGELLISQSEKVISAYHFSFNIRLSIEDEAIEAIPLTDNVRTLMQNMINDIEVPSSGGSSGSGLTTMPYYESELANYHAQPSDYPFANFMSDYLQMAVQSSSDALGKAQNIENEINTIKLGGSETASLLKDKTIAIIGDSITEVNGRTTKNYHQFIAERTGCNIVNLGYSGTGWQDRMTAANAITEQPDMIFIMLGTNDWAGVNGHKPLGDPNNIDGSMLVANINGLISQVVNKFPLTPVLTVTPIPRSESNPMYDNKNQDGYSLGELSDAIKAISAKFSIPCLDLYRESNLKVWIDAVNQSYFSMEGQAGDGLHPNIKGHEMLANMIQPFIESHIISEKTIYVPPAVVPVRNPDGSITTTATPSAITWDENSIIFNFKPEDVTIYDNQAVSSLKYGDAELINASGVMSNSPYWFALSNNPPGDYYNRIPEIEAFVSHLEQIGVTYTGGKQYLPVPLTITYK